MEKPKMIPKIINKLKIYEQIRRMLKTDPKKRQIFCFLLTYKAAEVVTAIKQFLVVNESSTPIGEDQQVI